MDTSINLIDFITNKLNLTIIGENLHDDTEYCGKQARHKHYLSVNNDYVFYSLYPNEFINNINIITDSENVNNKNIKEIQSSSVPNFNEQFQEENLPVATPIATSSNEQVTQHFYKK